MAAQASLLESDLTFASAEFAALDSRILRALADLSFAHPTLVQAKAIPLLLEGKDVFARARTGSGKTAAYCVPAVHKVLVAKAAVSSASADYQTTRVVILVPTRELALQVQGFLKSLTAYCDGVVSVINVATSGGGLQKILLNDRPDIVIATPSRLLSLLQSKSLDLAALSFLAVDEADLLLSYGHKDDLMRIMDPATGWIPRLGVQGCLVSATLSDEMEGIKGMILRNPAILTLAEPAASSSLLTQYYTHTSERDKFLLIYVLLKLKLIRGKSIIFVNDVERGYRVKLFLGQFGVKVCVVNSELPLASRYHVVEEFNRGVYDVIVATDEGAAVEDPQTAEENDPAEADADQDESASQADQEKEAESSAAGSSKKRSAPDTGRRGRKRPRDAASSMARGIDFTAASSVVNFDLPTSATSYLHRVGRTARAGHSGMALSFVVPKEQWGKDKGVSLKSAAQDEEVWARIRKRVKEDEGGELKEWDWGGRKGEIEGFRYRMEGALRAVTGKRVEEARREEVRKELLNSEKLKAHFAANPLDLAFLRHDQPLHPARQQSHLKHVPGYLMPKIAAAPLNSGDVGEGSHINFRQSNTNRGKAASRGRGGRGGSRGGRGGKKVDPLKFKA